MYFYIYFIKVRVVVLLIINIMLCYIKKEVDFVLFCFFKWWDGLNCFVFMNIIEIWGEGGDGYILLFS